MSLSYRLALALALVLVLACNGGPLGGAGPSSTTDDAAASTTAAVPTTTGGVDPTTASATTDELTTGELTTGGTADTVGTIIPCPRVPEQGWQDYDDDGEIDTILYSQGDVEKLAGCTDISGSLLISGSGITDLTPLASLRRIAGALSLQGSSNSPLDPAGPATLAGLESLESVRDLFLEATRLTDLAPLAGLTDIPGDVRIERHWRLASLAGLHNVKSVGGALSIDDCPQLADIADLASLQQVGVRMFFSHLPITSLHGLEALTTIGTEGGESRVGLHVLYQLASLDALAGVQWRPEHDIWIYGTAISNVDIFAGVPKLTALSLDINPMLTSLAGLQSLTTVSGGLRLGRNEQLTGLADLAGLQSVGALTFDETAFTDLVLPALAPPGELRISGNEQLTALSFLAGATSLPSLVLEFNPQLTGLPELTALTSVDGALELRSNAGMAALDDLAAVTHVGGRLAVVYNPELLQMDAEAWAAPIEVDGARKIVGNKGYDVPLLDPCPWADDGECDLKVCDGSDGGDCLSD